MRIYFFSSNQRVGPAQRRILGLLDSLGSQVATNLPWRGALQESSLRQSDENGEALMSRIDGLIIEGSHASHEARYFIASALSNKKTVLVLAAPGQKFETSVLALKNDRRVGGFLFLKSYSSTTLTRLVKAFINRVENSVSVDRPSIKFTFRITPAIDRYLNWKVRGTSMSKADFLRKLVWEEVVEKDEVYQKVEGSGEVG